MTAPTVAAPGGNKAAAVAPRPYPFPVGVYETLIQDYDNTIALGTISAWTSGTLAPLWNVSPTGWLRGLYFDFTLTIAGNSATPTLKADGPWTLTNKLTVYDLGGEVLWQLTGYEWMTAIKFGGYYEIGDPRADITYTVTGGSGASAGSVHYVMPVPFEIVSRDALGTIQNEAKPGYKIELYLGGANDVYATTPTAAGTASLRIRAYAENYTEPADMAPNGRPFAQTPPLPGSIQYWKSENNPLPSGNARYDLGNGMGFPIRNVIYYVRDAGDGTRATADPNFPDPATLQLGSVNIFTKSRALWNSRMGKDYGFTSVTPDTAMGREYGVYPVYFTRDFGLRPGAELRLKYLDTQVNTLLRFTGTFGGAVTFFALSNWLATTNRNRYALIGGN